MNRVMTIQCLARVGWGSSSRLGKSFSFRHKRPQKRKRFRSFAEFEENPDFDLDPFSPETHREFDALEKELAEEDDDKELFVADPKVTNEILSPNYPDYRIPHSFVGFDPRRMDLEDFPRLRTDFDGKRSELIWMGTECQRCGLQIRRERRTNRETSLNVYAHPSIPDDLLRHCPERKSYPVLWRTRDPYVALDILAVEDF